MSILPLLILSQSLIAQSTDLVVVENALPGNPSSEWDISGAGDSSIQGFATDISVNKGETVHFKINTSASAHQVKIYRLGYYQSNGARPIATVTPAAHLPQGQPPPVTDSSTGLIDCGNWAESTSWQAPTNATSGIPYHLGFIMWSHERHSDISVAAVQK